MFFHLCRDKGGAKTLAHRRPLLPALCLLAGSCKVSDPTRRPRIRGGKAFLFTPRGAPLPRFLFCFGMCFCYVFCLCLTKAVGWNV